MRQMYIKETGNLSGHTVKSQLFKKIYYKNVKLSYCVTRTAQLMNLLIGT